MSESGEGLREEDREGGERDGGATAPILTNTPRSSNTRKVPSRFNPDHDYIDPRIKLSAPRIHRKSREKTTFHKHFPSPMMPPSTSPSTLLPTRPFTPPSLIQSLSLSSPCPPMSPLHIDCDQPSYDLSPLSVTTSLSPIHSSPLSTTTPILSSPILSIPSTPIPSTPISVTPLTSGINVSFLSSQPKGPPLFSSHSSSPLSVHLPRPLTSFHSSSIPISAMESDSRQSISRFHLTAFLAHANPPFIPEPVTPNTRKSHIVHCSKTRAFILRAHAFFMENDLEDMTPRFLSLLLSIHPDTVYRVISDSSETSPLDRFPRCAPPPVKRTKKAEQERVKGRFSQQTIEKLRRFVHTEFFAQYRRVTLKIISDRKAEWIDPVDTNVAVSIPIVRLLLHSMNFSFVRLQYRSNVYMNDYYSRVQSHFLRTMLEIREAGNHLIWSVDETWIHKGMRPSIGWQDLEATRAPLTFIKNGLTAFERYVEGVFEALVAEAGEKELKPILLMDNAAYHSRVVDKMPTQNAQKAVIAEWLKAHDMPCEEGWKKKDMVAALKKLNRKDYNTYVVDTMGERYGVQVVRTPPYMAEYAPIEFGWSAMKRAQHDLITHSDDGGVIRVKLLEWMIKYPAEKCKKYMDHCKGKRIAEGGLTFSPSLSVEEIVEAAEEIIDAEDEEPVVDIDDLFFMSDIEEED